MHLMHTENPFLVYIIGKSGHFEYFSGLLRILLIHIPGYVPSYPPGYASDYKPVSDDSPKPDAPPTRK